MEYIMNFFGLFKKHKKFKETASESNEETEFALDEETESESDEEKNFSSDEETEFESD